MADGIGWSLLAMSLDMLTISETVLWPVVLIVTGAQSSAFAVDRTMPFDVLITQYRS